MPTGAAGSSITLEAQYQDGSGAAVAPTDPRVTIIDATGTEVVTDAVPASLGVLGAYAYEYAIPAGGPLGVWQAIWTGSVASVELTSTEVFIVGPAGSISFGTDCNAPMWISSELFMEVHPEVADLDDADLAVTEATWMLNALTGNRFHGVECRADIYRVPGRTKKIILEHGPIDEVFSVASIDLDTGVETELEGWRQNPGDVVKLPTVAQANLGFTGCAAQERMLKITYRSKPNLPPGTQRAVTKLAYEFWRSHHGMSCSLPERVTSVSREGINWTLLDPLDFLQRGLTGIGSIDQWVTALNMKGYARLIDPLTRPPLLESEVIGCGEGCAPT